MDGLLEHWKRAEDDPALSKVTHLALRRLTGLSFDRDREGWQAWWTNHREEVIKRQELKRERGRR